MTPQKEQLRQLERAQRMRAIGNWCLGLGVAAFAVSLTAAGFVGLGNPEIWSSLYIAMAAEGYFRWLVVPLVAAGIALFIVGVLAHAISARRNGEV